MELYDLLVQVVETFHERLVCQVLQSNASQAGGRGLPDVTMLYTIQHWRFPGGA